MTDTVSTTVLHNGTRKYVANFTNISDGTGESGVAKVDISGLTGPDGVNAPTTVTVERIDFVVNGFDYVHVYWDHTSDTTAAVLSGDGYKDYRDASGKRDSGTGGTGDVTFTTNGGFAGASYDITLYLRLEA